MKGAALLPFRLYPNSSGIEWPLILYSCGLHPQHTLHRPIGYPTLQCMICFGGEGTFYFENNFVLPLKKGEILFIPGKTAHDYGPEGSEPWMLGYMGIEGRDAESVLRALRLPILHPIAVNEHDLYRLEHELRELWYIPEHEEEPDRIASVKIYEILTCIAAMTQQGEPKQPYRSNAEAEKLLRAAVHYMEQHYMEEISVANIAYTIGYSQQHFQRRFKEMYGMNPSQYLQRLRLLKGAQLLEQEFERTVGEIAEMVGMELNYFVRVFKREYGITPAKYRAMQARHHDPAL